MLVYLHVLKPSIIYIYQALPNNYVSIFQNDTLRVVILKYTAKDQLLQAYLF